MYITFAQFSTGLCFWTVVLEKTLESPLGCKEIQPVHPEGDQPWDFFGGNDAEAETPVLWPPHAKSWLIGKDSNAGRDWGQEEKGTTEDEMAEWHHWLDGYESEWTLGVGDGQGGLACCDSWGRKESDKTERLNWTELSLITLIILVFSTLVTLWFIEDFISGILWELLEMWDLETHPGPTGSESPFEQDLGDLIARLSLRSTDAEHFLCLLNIW